MDRADYGSELNCDVSDPTYNAPQGLGSELPKIKAGRSGVIFSAGQPTCQQAGEAKNDNCSYDAREGKFAYICRVEG